MVKRLQLAIRIIAAVLVVVAAAVYWGEWTSLTISLLAIVVVAISVLYSLERRRPETSADQAPNPQA
ncbi:hypothetical protein [Isoptericola sp. BMS4]|uniref:hypothetical protein n=1 Tax=Isoptericola sp. BMS4 TaxID=2527875 RepID=UPI00141FFDEE|nr:hypothetical protein [Isoptericola sp. BMS4]